MTFTEFGPNSRANVPEHNRLRGLDQGDPHPQYADDGHDHDADYSTTTHTHARTDAAGNNVITYAAGGTVIAFGKTFDAAPVVTANIERPVGTDPYAIYVHNVTTTGFKAVIYAGSGAEAGVGAYRVYWHAIPAGT